MLFITFRWKWEDIKLSKSFCLYLLCRNGWKIMQNIHGTFYHNDNELFVSQFYCIELHWKEKGLKLIQDTHYPDEQGTSFIFECEKPVT